MALCLQENRIGTSDWSQWWGDLMVFDDTAREIVEYLVDEGYFEPDGPYLHIGPEAERRFGRRYFSDLTAVFTAPPEFLVLAGRAEVGTIGTDMLTDEVEGPRVLFLAAGRGRSRTWTGSADGALLRQPTVAVEPSGLDRARVCPTTSRVG